jgi:hypothetical protein
VLDARDLETAPPLDFLAATPSAVLVMATPSGPQRRDTAGQCHWRIAALSLRLNLRPDRGGRHHPCRVIPKRGFAKPAAAFPMGMVSKQAQFHGSLDRF